MNDPWSWPPVESGKLPCYLCQKFVSFHNGNTSEFFDHIATEHNVFVNPWLVLSIIFLDNNSLEEIRIQFKKNLNLNQVSKSQSEGKDGSEDIFGDDSDDELERYLEEFEDDSFDDNKKEGEELCKNSIEGDLLSNKIITPKYKPGPKSFKLKQQLEKGQSILPDSKQNSPPLKTETDKSKQSSEISNITMEEEFDNIITTNNQLFKSEEIIGAEHDLQKIKSNHTKQNIPVEGKNDQFHLDNTLPPNWKSRKAFRENKKSYDRYFMSPDGKIFRSRVKVVEHMKLMDIYSEEDYDKVIKKNIFDSLQEDSALYRSGPKSRKNKQQLDIGKKEEIKRINNDEKKSIQQEIKSETLYKNGNQNEDIALDNFVDVGHIENLDVKNVLVYNTEHIDDDWSKCEDLFDIDYDKLAGLKRKSNVHKLVQSTQLMTKKFTEKNETSLGDDVKNVLESFVFNENLGSEITNDTKTVEKSGTQNMEEQIKNIFEIDVKPIETVEKYEYQKVVQSSDEIDENFGRQQMKEEIKNMLNFDIFNKNVDNKIKPKKRKSSAKEPKQRKNKVLKQMENNQDVSSNALTYEPEVPSNEQQLSELNVEKSTSQYPIIGQFGLQYTRINVELAEYFRKRPNQLSGYNIAQSLKDQFVSDESLPTGWKIRKIWRETKKSYDTEFLSPDGRKARSRVAVVEYMKLMGIYSEPDYLKIMPKNTK